MSKLGALSMIMRDATLRNAAKAEVIDAATGVNVRPEAVTQLYASVIKLPYVEVPQAASQKADAGGTNWVLLGLGATLLAGVAYWALKK